MVTPVFQFVAIASYTVPGHLWKGPASILFASSIEVFTDINEILTKPSYPGWRVPALSALPHRWCSRHFIILVDLHWTLCSSSMSPLYWEVQNWTQYFSCGLTSAEQRFPVTAVKTACMTEISLLTLTPVAWCRTGNALPFLQIVYFNIITILQRWSVCIAQWSIPNCGMPSPCPSDMPCFVFLTSLLWIQGLSFLFSFLP